MGEFSGAAKDVAGEPQGKSGVGDETKCTQMEIRTELDDIKAT